ncbi:MAG: biotin/lipoyl-binding protein [Marinilabiliaceae bacterium]|nr:biotin/lipoyl-binding protein [Marinilabiliaceae bacterium]
MEESKKELVDFQVLSRKYKTQLTRKFNMRKPYVAPNPKEVRSYIPGTVVKINVKKGQKVKEGSSILVLEAMKMMNQIAMPFDGKIKEIYVKEGGRIPKDFLMIEIE